MKTWEMIKELTEHPEKKFNNVDGLSSRGYVSINKHKCAEIGLSKIVLDLDWQEVKNTVGWDKALEHMRNGNCTKLNGLIFYFNDSNHLRFRTENQSFGTTVELSTHMLDSEEWELL